MKFAQLGPQQDSAAPQCNYIILHLGSRFNNAVCDLFNPSFGTWALQQLMVRCSVDFKVDPRAKPTSSIAGLVSSLLKKLKRVQLIE